MAWLLAQFVLCAVLIAWAGYQLSVSADRLADAHGWGHGWVGLALLATVTSLPELASGLSAVTIVQAPNLAVGNALGSCVVNLAFLVVVDALQRHQPMYQVARSTHLLAAGFGVMLLGFAALSLLMGHHAPALLHVGLYSPVLVGLYLLALRSVFLHDVASHDEPPQPSGAAAAPAWRLFLLCAAIVLGAGLWLPVVADRLADALGLSRSFAGTVLMALVTTLPEMAVTLSALRRGALDMAIGNLLGSNLFNVAILAIDDVFYLPGPLLAAASPAHAATAVTAAMMCGLVIAGLQMRPRGRVLRLTSWVSLGLVALYAIHATLSYLAGP